MQVAFRYRIEFHPYFYRDLTFLCCLLRQQQISRSVPTLHGYLEIDNNRLKNKLFVVLTKEFVQAEPI